MSLEPAAIRHSLAKVLRDNDERLRRGAAGRALVEEFLQTLSASGRACVIGRGTCAERLAGADAYLPLLEALDGLRHFDRTHWVDAAMRQLAPASGDAKGPEAVQRPISALSR